MMTGLQRSICGWSIVVLILATNLIVVVVGENEDKGAAVPQPVVAENEVGEPHHAGPVDPDAVIAKDPYGGLLDSESYFGAGFVHAFVASLSVIIVSELGDKTFFIAAIMAMRHPRMTVFLAAVSALAFMTLMSAVLGYATTVIPHWFTHYASAALFLIFGLKMLKEGYDMSPDEGQEEYEEVQADLRKKDEELERSDPETGIVRTPQRRLLYSFASRIFIQAFTMTFLAEWGDRSQIATIILGAREDVVGVVIGGSLGHALCTGLAVLGGRFVAQKISVKTVTLVGGVVFVIFALTSLLMPLD